VRDECSDLLRVRGHQGQRVDRPAAAGEDVRRRVVQRGVQSVQLVRVLVWRGLGGVVGAFAALRSAGSYVTTVRSANCEARVLNPVALIGDPMSSRTGCLLASVLRTS
jgi:hypothetical protein